MKLTIVIPAYNEEKRIGKTLEDYGKFFKDLKKDKKIESKILIVINNTKDQTEEIVKKYQRKYKIIKYLNFKQGGKGFAVSEGFKEALKSDSDIIGFVDADMSTSPEEFFKLVDNLKNCGGVIASRYVEGSIVKPRQSFRRVLASRVFNFIIRSLFLIPYRDTQLGAKVFRKEVLEKIVPQLGMTHWAFDIDLLYRANKQGIRIKEVPTAWQDRECSHINLNKAGMQMLLSAAQFRIINSPFKRILKPLRPIMKRIWKLSK